MTKFDASIPDDMQSVIDNCTAGLAGVGFIAGPFGPGTDLPIIAPTWIWMTYELGQRAGSSLSKHKAKKIAMAVLTGAGAFLAGTKVASAVLGWLGAFFTLGSSLIISGVANAAINAAFTRSYGRSVAKFFIAAGDIDDVEVAIQVLIAMTGRDYGFKTPYDDLLT